MHHLQLYSREVEAVKFKVVCMGVLIATVRHIAASVSVGVCACLGSFGTLSRFYKLFELLENGSGITYFSRSRDICVAACTKC